jgi:hypothetical protein
MSQSTPINMLRRNANNNNQQMPDISQMSQPLGNTGEFPEDNNTASQLLVEDILKEMGESPGAEQQSNINSQALQYAMDSSQVPPNKYIPTHNPQQNQTHSDSDYDNYRQKMMIEQNNGILGQLGINLSGETLREKIMKNIKYPALVFVICFLISLPEFNRFLFGFFPRLLLESGQVSIGGVMLKALVGMILYAIIVLFI